MALVMALCGQRECVFICLPQDCEKYNGTVVGTEAKKCPRKKSSVCCEDHRASAMEDESDTHRPIPHGLVNSRIRPSVCLPSVSWKLLREKRRRETGKHTHTHTKKKHTHTHTHTHTQTHTDTHTYIQRERERSGPTALLWYNVWGLESPNSKGGHTQSDPVICNWLSSTTFPMAQLVPFLFLKPRSSLLFFHVGGEQNGDVFLHDLSRIHQGAPWLPWLSGRGKKWVATWKRRSGLPSRRAFRASATEPRGASEGTVNLT